MNKREVFERARVILQKPGVWVKEPVDSNCHCLWTACAEVIDDDTCGLRLNVIRAISAKIQTSNLEHVTEIWEWNDAPERTLEDVIKVLDELILDEIKNDEARKMLCDGST